MNFFSLFTALLLAFNCVSASMTASATSSVAVATRTLITVTLHTATASESAVAFAASTPYPAPASISIRAALTTCFKTYINRFSQMITKAFNDYCAEELTVDETDEMRLLAAEARVAAILKEMAEEYKCLERFQINAFDVTVNESTSRSVTTTITTASTIPKLYTESLSPDTASLVWFYMPVFEFSLLLVALYVEAFVASVSHLSGYTWNKLKTAALNACGKVSTAFKMTPICVALQLVLSGQFTATRILTVSPSIACNLQTYLERASFTETRQTKMPYEAGAPEPKPTTQDKQAKCTEGICAPRPVLLIEYKIEECSCSSQVSDAESEASEESGFDDKIIVIRGNEKLVSMWAPKEDTSSDNKIIEIRGNEKLVSMWAPKEDTSSDAKIIEIRGNEKLVSIWAPKEDIKEEITPVPVADKKKSLQSPSKRQTQLKPKQTPKCPPKNKSGDATKTKPKRKTQQAPKKPSKVNTVDATMDSTTEKSKPKRKTRRASNKYNKLQPKLESSL